jgi:hypothetical protein
MVRFLLGIFYVFFGVFFLENVLEGWLENGVTIGKYGTPFYREEKPTYFFLILFIQLFIGLLLLLAGLRDCFPNGSAVQKFLDKLLKLKG